MPASPAQILRKGAHTGFCLQTALSGQKRPTAPLLSPPARQHPPPRRPGRPALSKGPERCPKGEEQGSGSGRDPRAPLPRAQGSLQSGMAVHSLKVASWGGPWNEPGLRGQVRNGTKTISLPFCLWIYFPSAGSQTLLADEGEHFIHPNMLLGDTDCFKLLIFKKHKTQKEPFTSPLAA